MKKVMLVLMMFVVAGYANAAFTETFDSFTPLGTLQAQPAPINWEAHSLVDVVTNGSGRALQTTSYTDKTFRHNGTGVDFGLTKDQMGFEYGFDFVENSSTVVNLRMYMRTGRTATYSPSFGFGSGTTMLRFNGEGGTTITGTDMASSAIYGAGTAEDPGYWLKGDVLHCSLILTGTAFDTATMKIYNLSRGGLEIPTGITDVVLGVNPLYHSSWNTFNFRGGTSNSVVDNAYVTDYVVPEPATLALLGLGGLLLRKKR
jgi:hypothetical protein